MSDSVASVGAKRTPRKGVAVKAASASPKAVAPAQATVDAAAPLPPAVAKEAGRTAKKLVTPARRMAKPAAPTTKASVERAQSGMKAVAPKSAPGELAPPVVEPVLPLAELAVAMLEAAPTPAPAIDFIEAAMSPAVSSDTIPAEPKMLATIARGNEKMTTVTTENTAFASDKLQSLFGDVGERFKAGFEKSTKMSEEMVDLAKGNVEAVVASARVAAKGSETLGQDAAAYSKKSFESAVAAMKGFASVKSPTELFQLQSDFAKASFDSAVAEASKFSESMMKLAGEVAQPLSSRYAVAAEKIKAVAL